MNKHTAHLAASTKHLEHEICFNALKNCAVFEKLMPVNNLYRPQIFMWDATSTLILFIFAPQEGFVHCVGFMKHSKILFYL